MKFRWFSVLIFCFCFVFVFCDDETKNRIKRQYYDEGYAYGSYYGWQVGRILGWVLGCILVLICLCLPCICCVGICFLGWFGFRRRSQPPQQSAQQPLSIISRIRRSMSRNNNVQPIIVRSNSIPPTSPLPTNTIVEERIPVEESGLDGARIQRVIYAQDRFFERERRREPSDFYGRGDRDRRY